MADDAQRPRRRSRGGLALGGLFLLLLLVPLVIFGLGAIGDDGGNPGSTAQAQPANSAGAAQASGELVVEELSVLPFQPGFELADHAGQQAFGRNLVVRAVDGRDVLVSGAPRDRDQVLVTVRPRAPRVRPGDRVDVTGVVRAASDEVPASRVVGAYVAAQKIRAR